MSASERGQHATLRAHLDAPQRAVEQLLFLESRPVHRGVGNLVSAGALGWVRMWECHAEGELVVQFNASHRPGAGITALCTDRPNYDYLVTGDTDGYVKVWYIPQYANAASETQLSEEGPPRAERFQLLRETMIWRLVTVQRGRFPPPSAASDPDRTWTAPLLVTAFHAHLNVVTSLDYVDGHDCFLSSSDDCSVRLWTVYGAFVGIFGQNTPWLPTEPPPTVPADTGQTFEGDPGVTPSRPIDRGRSSVAGEIRYQPRRVPADVRRVASACTLRVMYGGHVPQWKSTRAKLVAFVEVVRRLWDIAFKRRSTMTSTDDDAAAKPIHIRLQLSDLPSVEHSRILGKAYRRQRRYRPLPAVPRVLQNDLKVSLSQLHYHTTNVT